MTQVLKAGLIGHGISASLTPLMHEAEGGALGLKYSYLRIDVASPEFAGKSMSDLLMYAEDQGFLGVNITHPFKVEAATIADELSYTAASLGAINTMIFRDGRRIGHNTDYTGYRSALRAEKSIGPINRMLLLGAGGAGAAVALALLDQGCEDLTICDPVEGLASTLAQKLMSLRPQKTVRCVETHRGVDLHRMDGVVNATPLGMKGHEGMALDPDQLSPVTWVGDIVYFPLETELLREASARGLQVMNGGSMAVFQAVAAFELLTRRKPNASRMQAHFLSLTSSRPNAQPTAALN